MQKLRKFILSILLLLSIVSEYRAQVFVSMTETLLRRRENIIQNKLIPIAIKYGEKLQEDKSVSHEYKAEYFVALKELTRRLRKKKTLCDFLFFSWCDVAEQWVHIWFIYFWLEIVFYARIWRMTSYDLIMIDKVLKLMELFFS